MYHLPEISRLPNFVGTKQKRPYIFKGDLLQFADKATDEPGVESWTITWRGIHSTDRNENCRKISISLKMPEKGAHLR